MAEILEKLFGSRTRTKLITWFFTHIEEKFFIRQLAPILREDHANISRELIRLEKLGILASIRQGSQKYFQVNKDCSFLGELRGLVLKTTGIAGQLKAELETIKGTRFALIYGSFARGQETADSDVDLLLVGNVNQDILDTALQELEKKLGRTINYVLYDWKEFKEKVSSRDGFLTDVLAGDKIILMGEIGGFEAV
jgi:predicted nucleotidyltransferase